MMSYVFSASTAVYKDKGYFSHFEPVEVDTMSEVGSYMLTHSLSVNLYNPELTATSGGKLVPFRKSKDTVIGTGNLIFIDIDKGSPRKKDLVAALDSMECPYALVPSRGSTMMLRKWHIALAVEGADVSYEDYKNHYRGVAQLLGFEYDEAMSSSVQNMTPSLGKKLSKVCEDGKPLDFKQFFAHRRVTDSGGVSSEMSAKVNTLIDKKKMLTKRGKPFVTAGELVDMSRKMGDDPIKCDCPFDDPQIHSDGCGEMYAWAWKGHIYCQGSHGHLRGSTEMATIAEEELMLGDSKKRDNRRKRFIEIEYKFKHELIDADACLAYMDNTVWNPDKQKFVWMSSSGYIRAFTQSDMPGFFTGVYAEVTQKAKESLEYEIINNAVGPDATLVQQAKALKDFYMSVYHDIATWVKRERQHTVIKYKVDPWTKYPRATVDKFRAEATITHNRVLPNKPKKVVNKAVIADYKEHFPMLDEFLDVVTAMRFGADRKKSYLWLQAESDWGKSFFFSGILGKLGLTVTLKEAELKKAMKGDPVGMNPGEFVFAWMVVFEEFKGAVSELKDITHTIQMSPKNQGRAEVDVYGKVFLSAEDVLSLKNENGIEKQFANRFSRIQLEGSLVARTMYASDEAGYLAALTWYVYGYLKKLVKEYVKMGEHEASLKANAIVNRMRAKHKIEADDEMGLEEKVRLDAKAWLAEKAASASAVETDRDSSIFSHNGVAYVKNKGRAKEAFLNEVYSLKERIPIDHKSANAIFGECLIKTSIYKNGMQINAFRIELPIDKKV